VDTFGLSWQAETEGNDYQKYVWNQKWCSRHERLIHRIKIEALPIPKQARFSDSHCRSALCAVGMNNVVKGQDRPAGVGVTALAGLDSPSAQGSRLKVLLQLLPRRQERFTFFGCRIMDSYSDRASRSFLALRSLMKSLLTE
jgi:hypothetical protein